MSTGKINYKVVGEVEGVGEITEYVHAYSEAQAIKLVANRLAKRYPTIPIFIENSSATTIKNPV